MLKPHTKNYWIIIAAPFAVDISAKAIETYLTPNKVGKGKIKGTANTFVTHYSLEGLACYPCDTILQ